MSMLIDQSHCLLQTKLNDTDMDAVGFDKIFCENA